MRRIDYFLAGLGGALMVALFYLLSPAVLQAVQYPPVMLTDNTGNYVGSVSNPIAVSGAGSSPTSPSQVLSLGVNTPAPVTAGDIETLDTNSSGVHMCLGSPLGNWVGLGYGPCPMSSVNYALITSPGGGTLINAGSGLSVNTRIANADVVSVNATGMTVLGSLSANGTTISAANGGAIQSTGGTAPTLTAGCNGAGSSVVAGSTNNRGSFVTSTAAATTCTLHFSAAGVWNQIPHCQFYDANGSITPTPVSSGTCTVTDCFAFFASKTSWTIGYLCM